MTRITLTLEGWGNAGHLGQRSGVNTDIIIVADATTGVEIGRLERDETFSERGTGTYYDVHRHAKGDRLVSHSGGIRWTGPDGLPTQICDAIFGTKRVGLCATWREAVNGDADWFWRSLCERCRGFQYHVPKRPRDDRDREIMAQNAARQLAVYDIAATLVSQANA